MVPMYTLLLSLCWSCSVFASAQEQTTITASKSLRDPEILVSSNDRFHAGFFSPGNSSNRYFGIWYNKPDSDTSEVTWVANRDNPLNDSSGVLKISETGNLELLNGQNKTFWSSSYVSLGGNGGSIAQLQDNGNLVLVPSSSGTISWQSFDHPTNSWLPQMQLTIDKNTNEKKQLTSWKNLSDPSSGRFTCGLNPRNVLTEAFIWDGDLPYWRSGPWSGNIFLGVPSMNSAYLDAFSLVNDGEGKYSLGFSSANQSLFIHLELSSDGVLSHRHWEYASQKWEINWSSRESDCNIYGKCGPFGSCNPKNSPICGCLKGFEPKNTEEWRNGNWSSGCVRRTPLKCNSSTGTTIDGFLKLRNMEVPDNAEWQYSNDEEACGRQCLGKCQCLAYAYNSNIGCMKWNNSLIDIQEFSLDGVDLFIRLAHSELGHTSKWKIILTVLMIMGAAAFAVTCFLWKWMGRRKGKRVVTEDKLVDGNKFNPYTSQVEIQDLPIFTFKTLVIATNNFQETNKLGEGGFGPVYKGKLEDGQEIAVKRLSRASGQGQQEFMNEVVLISKLQHINLVRLLGCCVEGDEKMLVYEYMPNKSLNALLFDPLQKEILDWKKRFNIIDGICRGLLYLHRDSRLRIIHRDLKGGNILLDGDLNPKISDFGMARIFGRNEDQANTLRVVGTYGYMSPEYAMEGWFSEKSDVFSFGVLLLEIISGRRITSFDDNQGLSLLGYAWRLWNEDNTTQLIDASIWDSYFQVDFKRCIQVALLCVQEYPEERPSVSTIVSMLHSEIASLPLPNQPGFTQRKPHEFQENGQQFNSANRVSLSSINGR